MDYKNKYICNWMGNLITINEPMGSVKSHFIKNDLYEYAKEHNEKILFLVHRINCKIQFTNDIIGKDDTIKIDSYQSIQATYKSIHNPQYNFNEYDYIVCDEMHYFMTDSLFNNSTDISFNAIIGQLEYGKCVILMSATGNEMMSYIRDNINIAPIEYNTEDDYKFINNLIFWNHNNILDRYIKEVIQSGKKAIFFIQSAIQGFRLYERYKDYCMFNCGKSDKHYKYIADEEKELITELLVTERLPKQILITTTCMDSGINIFDKDVTKIFVDVKDINTMIQCIGRKRIIGGEKIDVYIKNITNRQLHGMSKKNENDLIPAQDYISMTEEEWIKKYSRVQCKVKCIYDHYSNGEAKKIFNKLMYYKMMYDMTLFQNIKNRGEFGYCEYISSIFKIKYEIQEELDHDDEISSYLKSIVGNKLNNSGRQNLIDVIDLRDSKNRQQKSISLLNRYLHENHYKYVILAKKTGNVRYWQLEEIM